MPPSRRVLWLLLILAAAVALLRPWLADRSSVAPAPVQPASSPPSEPAEERCRKAKLLAEQGEELIDLGAAEEALAAFNQGMTLLRPWECPEARHGLVDGAGLAHFEISKERTRISAALHLRALQLAQHPLQRTQTLHRLGVLLTFQGRVDLGAKALEEALSLARREQDGQFEAYSLADLAHARHEQGKLDEAWRMFDEASGLFVEEVYRPIYQASALFGRAEVERDQGRLDEALASVGRSVAILEAERADVLEPQLRRGFFGSRQRFYALYTDLLMTKPGGDPGAGHVVRAFEAAERSRARSLLDDMAGGGRPTEARPLPEIQRELLDEETLFLAYGLGEDRSFLWAVTAEGIQAFELPSKEALDELVRAALGRLRDEKERPDLVELSRLLLPEGLPLRRHLLVSPDGVLHLVPFAALLGHGGRPLVFDHVVTYAPSASVLVEARRKLSARRPAPKVLAALADAVFNPDDDRLDRPPGVAVEKLDRLLYTRREADAILALVPPGESLKAEGFDANRSLALDRRLRDFQILHFATHNVVHDDPERSGLILSRFDARGRPIEGLVSASDVYRLDLGADLAVLSACDTGLGEDIPGEGIVGLARAFLHAGARRVVVTLWKVDDRGSSELMIRFYERMLRGDLPPSEALRAAQESMATDPKWSHPYYWAGFILQGEPD